MSDWESQRIRKMTVVSSGTPDIISTIAGSVDIGGYSGDGSAATFASLNAPLGVAVDTSGTVF